MDNQTYRTPSETMNNHTYRLPAEWEPQSGIQLTWPHDETDWAPMLSDILTTYRQMALEISKRERLLVVAPEGKAPDMLHVVCPTNDTWARDHGFITRRATLLSTPHRERAQARLSCSTSGSTAGARSFPPTSTTPSTAGSTM